MKFVIRDKIIFKNENIHGEIIKINSPYKVRILSSEGLEMNVSVRDLIKVEQGTDKASSYGTNFFQKEEYSKLVKSQKKQRSQSQLKIDLHIELLSSNYMNLDDLEIVQIQINECYNKIEYALNSNVNKLEIIHGIGGGVLKDRVHEILKIYNLRFYLSKDGGATEVFF